MARVQRSSSRRLSPRNSTAMASAAICSSAISAAVYAAINQSIWAVAQLTAVALGCG